MINLTIDKKLYDDIANEIHSDKSPVGIDAKKTHVLILQKLLQLEKRLDSIETKLDQAASWVALTATIS